MQGILSVLQRIPWQIVGWAVLLGFLQWALFLAPTLLGQNSALWQAIAGCLLFLMIPGIAGWLMSRRRTERPQATRAGCWTAVVALVLLLPLPWILASITSDAQIRLCNEQQHGHYACFGVGLVKIFAPLIFYGLFVLYSIVGGLLATLGGWIAGRLGPRKASNTGP